MKMAPALERSARLSERAHLNRLTRNKRIVHDTLTDREREVATLVAAGRTNAEIGEQLVISEGTVDVHVKHILSKLGFRSRAQIAAWVVQHAPKQPEPRTDVS
jgi:DNA-binding NarL/FixJ family response regulator